MKDVQETDIPEDRKRNMADSIAKLSGLYTQFRATNASRFGDEITRQVQAILKDLEACPKAQNLDAAFREGLHNLHEQLGIPALRLKAAAVPRKPRKK